MVSIVNTYLHTYIIVRIILYTLFPFDVRSRLILPIWFVRFLFHLFSPSYFSFSVTEYFKGNNWKVHPDWVYCEYNSASDKLFSSPEERVLHFLSRTRKPGWKWMSLRPRSPSSHHKQASKPDKDAYYCKCKNGRIIQSNYYYYSSVRESFERAFLFERLRFNLPYYSFQATRDYFNL